VRTFSRLVNLCLMGSVALLSAASCQIDDRALIVDAGGAIETGEGTDADQGMGEGGIGTGGDATLIDTGGDVTLIDTGGDVTLRDGPIVNESGLGDSGSEAGDAGPADAATRDAGGGDGPATGLLANGASCSGGSACASNICLDGVCCQTACADACSACNVTGLAGTCSPVPSGQAPATGHPTCGPDTKASCARDGTCDGQRACRKWAATTVCASPSCNATANTAVGPSTCDGNGNCVAPASVLCAPFTCLPDNSACYQTCSGTSTGCSSGNVCTAGSCGLKVTGSACTAGGQCASNECVDGVCCTSACSGQCEACDVTGQVGTCTTLTSGAPHGSRPACTTDGTACAGACGGTATACTYPGASTGCRTQTCSSATLTLAATCNGAGACPAVMQQTCTVPANGSAVCSGNACGVTCNTYYQPAAGSTCALAWTAESTPSTAGLLGIWGSSATDVFAIDYAHIYHSTGSGVWTTNFTASGFQDFNAIWGDPWDTSYIYVVGTVGTILQTANDGQTWTQVTDPNNNNNYYTVTGNGSTAAGTAPLGVYALGSEYAWFNPQGWQVLGTTNSSIGVNLVSAWAYFYSPYVVAGADNGTIWGSDTNGNFSQIYSTGWSTVAGIWGFQPSSGGDIFAVGGGGGIALALTSSCSTSSGPISCSFAQQTSGTTQSLSAVYGVQSGSSGPFTYFVVGNSGTILSSSGNGTWAAQASNTTAGLTGVFAATPTNVYACGADGKVMHFNGP
jgi:hypothetical protein